ncbi:MAG: hypothetical protein IIA49_03400 [Bacteroidetes bacterium]|nr:hypothetical protein [Bacteroidota bacterium]
MNCENKTKYVVGFCQIPAGNVAVLNSHILYQNSKDLTNPKTRCSLTQQGEQRFIILCVLTRTLEYVVQPENVTLKLFQGLKTN